MKSMPKDANGGKSPTAKKADAKAPCVDCNVDTVAIDEYYMVHDRVWVASGLGKDDGCLCFDCLKKRLGRDLNSSDFTDCLLNDICGYKAKYANGGTTSPQGIAEWLFGDSTVKDHLIGGLEHLFWFFYNELEVTYRGDFDYAVAALAAHLTTERGEKLVDALNDLRNELPPLFALAAKLKAEGGLT